MPDNRPVPARHRAGGVALRLAAALAATVLAAGSAAAATITFDTLAGANGTPFAGTTEAGFTVTPIEGNWFVAQVFGNPTPSIFGGPIGSPVTAAIEVTDGDFTFSSVDVTSNGAAGTTFQLLGFLDDAPIFDETGTILSANTFVTASLGTTAAIDRLVIRLTPGTDVTSFNLDNIVVTAVPPVGVPVPEPGALSLLALSLLAFAAARRAREAS